eukprot:m.25866 g.25866  ORF g.25866 m.25866 type:complete len:1597 (+) comp6245_c0_seq1:350-5140(+)
MGRPLQSRQTGMVQAATVALGCALAFCAPKTGMGQGVEVFEEVGMMPFRGCHSSTSQQCISTAGSNSTAPRVCTFRILRAATITPRGHSPHRPTITIDNTSLLNVSGTFTVQPGQLVEWTSDRRLDDFFLCANGVQPQLSCASTGHVNSQSTNDCAATTDECIVGRSASHVAFEFSTCATTFVFGNVCPYLRWLYAGTVPSNGVYCGDHFDIADEIQIQAGSPIPLHDLSFCCCSGVLCNDDLSVLYAEATAANTTFSCQQIPIPSFISGFGCYTTDAPTAAPTTAPTPCGVSVGGLIPDTFGVVTVPRELAGCEGVRGSAFRLPNSTTTLAFPHSGVSNLTALPDAFASMVADIPELTLDLSDNVYTTIPPNSFAPFAQQLTGLLLSRGRISTVAVGAFRLLTNLLTLRVDDNTISNLDWLAGMVTLENFDARNNHIIVISNDTFVEAPLLLSLKLSGNDISLMDIDPFRVNNRLIDTNVVLYDNVVLCAAIPKSGNGSALQCGGCRAGHRFSEFQSHDGRYFCSEPGRVQITAAVQYIPESSPLGWDSDGNSGAVSAAAMSQASGCTATAFSRHTRNLWALGRPYRIAPIQAEDARVTVPTPVTAAVDSIGVVVHYVLDPLPQGMFINSNTGEIVGQPEQTGVVRSRLYATYPRATNLTVTTITFNVTLADTDVPAYGPNGQDCAVESQRVDIIEFDGEFSCNCSATTLTGTGPNCLFASAETGAHSTDRDIMIIVTVTVVLVAVVVALLLYRNARRERLKAMQPANFEGILAALAEKGIRNGRRLNSAEAKGQVSAIAPTEIKRRDLILRKKIGQGHFGEVAEALFQTTTSAGGRHVSVTINVAVKVQRSFEHVGAKDDFLREAAVTWQFQHKNVVQMHGVVTSGLPYLLVLELCTAGELKKYLECPEHANIDNGQLFHFVLGVAEGMGHLAELNFVHRDLACRNVLLNHDLVPKIADFGMGRDLAESGHYSAAPASYMVLPMRWTDPSVLDHRHFSELTDVWSFGVAVVEMYTQGATPYEGWSTSLVISRVKNGYTLPKPDRCPESLFTSVVRPCWNPLNTDQGQPRPTFSQIVQRLRELQYSLEMVPGSTRSVESTQRKTFAKFDADGREDCDSGVSNWSLSTAASTSSSKKSHNRRPRRRKSDPGVSGLSLKSSAPELDRPLGKTKAKRPSPIFETELSFPNSEVRQDGPIVRSPTGVDYVALGSASSSETPLYSQEQDLYPPHRANSTRTGTIDSMTSEDSSRSRDADTLGSYWSLKTSTSAGSDSDAPNNDVETRKRSGSDALLRGVPLDSTLSTSDPSLNVPKSKRPSPIYEADCDPLYRAPEESVPSSAIVYNRVGVGYVAVNSDGSPPVTPQLYPLVRTDVSNDAADGAMPEPDDWTGVAGASDQSHHEVPKAMGASTSSDAPLSDAIVDSSTEAGYVAVGAGPLPPVELYPQVRDSNTKPRTQLSDKELDSAKRVAGSGSARSLEDRASARSVWADGVEYVPVADSPSDPYTSPESLQVDEGTLNSEEYDYIQLPTAPSESIVYSAQGVGYVAFAEAAHHRSYNLIDPVPTDCASRRETLLGEGKTPLQSTRRKSKAGSSDSEI